MADFDVTLGADISDILAELRRVSSVGDKEFKDLAKGIEKQFSNTRREAARLRKAMQTDVGAQGKAAFESVKQAAEGLGGKIGGTVAGVEKFGRAVFEAGAAAGPFGATIAAAGVAAAGTTLALAALTAGIVKGIEAAGEWARELEHIQGITAIPPETVDSVNEFNRGIAGLGAELKAVGVILAGAFADNLNQALTVSLKLTLALGDLIGNAGALRGVVSGLGRAIAEDLFPPLALWNAEAELMGANTSFLGLALNKLDDATASYDERVRRLTTSLAVADGTNGKLSDRFKGLTKVIDDNKKVVIEHKSATKAADTSQQDWLKTLQESERAAASVAAITARASSDTQSATEKITAAYQEREAALTRLIGVSRDQEALAAAFAANEERRQRDLATLYQDTIRGAADSYAAVIATLESVASEAYARINDIAANVATIANNLGGALAAVADLAQQRISKHLANTELALKQNQKAQEKAAEAGDELRLAELESQEKALATRQLSQQKAITSAFRAEKALGIAEAGINGAVAVTQALAIPPPFGAAVVASIVAATAAQIGVIQAQAPPKFAAGGLVRDRMSGDSRLIIAEAEEGILTGQGVAAAGGRAGLAALNRGERQGQVIQIVIGSDVIAEAMASGQNARVVARAIRPFLSSRGG